MADNIYVCVRMRPPMGDDPANYWKMRNQVLENPDGRKFRFERVFDPATKTKEIWDEVARPIADNILSGFNGTIFAYGQTGSGKTHTIHGTPQEKGIVPRVINYLFDHIKQQSDQLFLVRVSFWEIYNEELNDLLVPKSRSGRSSNGKDLLIREVKGQFKVMRATEKTVKSPEEVLELIEQGNTNRSVGVSNINEHSSRSHSIFRMVIESAQRVDEADKTKSTCQRCQEVDATTRCDDCGEKYCSACCRVLHKSKNKQLHRMQDLGGLGAGGAVKVSELNLVDLAGTETLSYSFGASQQKETKHINLSLTQLKTVIQSLSKGEGFIPYRNSTLTKVLKNSLGGNSKTAIICAANPANRHTQSTTSTLNFGSMAKTIKNKAKVNEVFDDESAMLKAYKKKIAAMESRMADYDRMEAEKRRIQEEYDKLKSQIEDLRSLERQKAAMEDEVDEMGVINGGGGGEGRGHGERGITDSQMSEMTKSLGELKNENIQLAMLLKKQTDELKAAELQQQQKVLDFKNKLEREREDNDLLAAKLRDQMEDKRSHEDRILRQIEATQAELERERRQKEELAKELKEKTDDNLKAVDAHVQERLAALQKQRDATQAQNSQLTGEIEEQRRQAERNEQEIRQKVKAYAKKLDREQLANAQLARELQDQRNANEDIEERIAQQISTINSTLEKKQADNKRLQRELELADEKGRKELKKIEEQAKLKEKQVKMLEREMSKSDMLHKQKLEAIEVDMKESGMDKDSYLAFLIDSYERKIVGLEHTNNDLKGMSEALKMDAEQQIQDLTRRLKVYKAQVGSQSPMPASKPLGADRQPAQPGPLLPPISEEQAAELKQRVSSMEQELVESHKREQFLENELKDSHEKLKLMAIALEGD